VHVEVTGADSVKLTWSVGELSEEVDLSPTGGTATIGPFPAGTVSNDQATINVTVVATNTGGQTQESTTITLRRCER
jgi:hypothetical protein